MTSEPVRDPLADHLLTPQNCALIIIDYQPVQVSSVRSMDQDLLVDRVVPLARFGMLYRLPGRIVDGQRQHRPEPADHRAASGRIARGSRPWTGPASTPGKTPGSSRRSGPLAVAS